MSLYDKFSKDKDDSIFVNFIENDFKVKDFIHLKPTEYTDQFVIEFKPTDNCNFNCSYCCFHDNSTKNMSDEIFDNYLKVLDEYNIFQKDIFIFVYGGEPTMHPKLTEMIIRMNELFKSKNKNVKTLIQTNGMKWTVSDYKKNHELLTKHDIKYVVSFSYHKEFTKMAGVVKRINYLKSIKVMDVMTYMITRADIDRHVKNIKLFKSLKVPLYVRTILQESEWFLNSKYYKYITIDPDETPFILSDASGDKEVSFEYITTNGYLNFKGYKCSAGKNTLLMAPNGKVYRCDMDFLYDRNVMYDVTKSTDVINEFQNCEKCEHKFCSIYYSDKFR